MSQVSSELRCAVCAVWSCASFSMACLWQQWKVGSVMSVACWALCHPLHQTDQRLVEQKLTQLRDHGLKVRRRCCCRCR